MRAAKRSAFIDDDARLVEAAEALRRAERPIRVLRTLAWSPRVAERFFATKATELPRVTYEVPDPTYTLEGVQYVRSLVGKERPEERWLRRQATAVARSAKMLASVGTPAFHRFSCKLYGLPTDPLLPGRTTSLQLARRLHRILSRIDHDDLGPPPRPLSPADLAKRVQAEIATLFGKAAPRVQVVSHLSAKAVAGARRILVHGRAQFTDEDVRQLVVHEAMVHVATTLNGLGQRRLPILGCGHAGTTRTQEGLAVFSELISGAMTPSRFRRLANRVLAIDRSMRGADFLDIYRFFLERTDDPAQSFEDTRRVFRGGVLTGGGPFTKDGVYIDGLVRVHNFLRSVVLLHRSDVMPLLFCGKLDLEDIPAVAVLVRRGLVRLPRYLPPWAVDRRFLVSYLAYSGFLNRVRAVAVRAHYRALLEQT